MEQTYVQGEIEVRLTGRKAAKPGPAGRSIELVEITPVNEYDGTWKKWANPQALFAIVQPKE